MKLSAPNTSTGFTLAVILSLGAFLPAYAQAPRSPTPAPLSGIVQAETVARGLEHRSLCIPRARPGSIGKIMRVNPDGSVPKDNPFVGRSGVLPEIWSYGHRNVQAAALHPRTGQLWTAEHGARGGDELNHPEAGKNYGWPVTTYGVDYSGAMIGEGTAKPGMEQPVYYWDPVIAQRRREYRQAL